MLSSCEKAIKSAVIFSNNIISCPASEQELDQMNTMYTE